MLHPECRPKHLKRTGACRRHCHPVSRWWTAHIFWLCSDFLKPLTPPKPPDTECSHSLETGTTPPTDRPDGPVHSEHAYGLVRHLLLSLSKLSLLQLAVSAAACSSAPGSSRTLDITGSRGAAVPANRPGTHPLVEWSAGLAACNLPYTHPPACAVDPCMMPGLTPPYTILIPQRQPPLVQRHAASHKPLAVQHFPTPFAFTPSVPCLPPAPPACLASCPL